LKPRTAASSCPRRGCDLEEGEASAGPAAAERSTIRAFLADPKVKDTVWVLNVNIYKSTDAGKTWKASNVPHGDNHDMWIASNDSNRMIEGNDGGGTISVNGGAT
jgi:hypothetical protein